MLNRDQIALIHQEVDGANSAEESAALRTLIEGSPEAKALEADLRQVTQLFDRVGQREPPPHLRQAILDALPQQPRAASGWDSLGNAVKVLVTGLQQRPRFALVSALSVGLVAGFGLYAVFAGTVLPDRSSTGGLAGTFGEPPAAQEGGTVHAVAIDVAGASGRVSVTAGRNDVTVALELRVQRAVEVRLNFDERAYDLRAFSQLRREAEPRFTGEPGVIRVSTAGANTHTFVLHHEGPVSPLVLSLFDGGEEIFATMLDAREPSPGGMVRSPGDTRP